MACFLCNREVSFRVCSTGGALAAEPGQEHPWHAGTILAWECSSMLLCPQSSAVAPTTAPGERIGEGRHCLGLCVTSQCHLPVSPPSSLPRALESSTCAPGTASATQGKRDSSSSCWSGNMWAGQWNMSSDVSEGHISQDLKPVNLRETSAFTWSTRF